MHEKERISSRALLQSPTKGPDRIHEKKMRPTRRISTYMPFYPKYWSYFAGTTCSVDATLIKRPAEIALVFRTMTPRRVRSARSAAPTIGELPFASRDVGIIAKTPRGNQARRNEITVRTKSHIPRRPKGGAAKHIHRPKVAAEGSR